MNPDILDVLLSRADPALAPQLKPLVGELRREYGGDTVYVRQYVQPVTDNTRLVVRQITRRTVQRRQKMTQETP